MPHMHTCMTQQLQYIHGYSTALNAPLVHELDNWSIQYLQWAWLCAVEVAHGMSRCLDAKGGRFVHIFDYNNENLYPTIDYRATYVVSIIYDPTMMSRSPHTAILCWLTNNQPDIRNRLFHLHMYVLHGLIVLMTIQKWSTLVQNSQRTALFICTCTCYTAWLYWWPYKNEALLYKILSTLH